MEANKENKRDEEQLWFKKAWLPGLLLIILIASVVFYYFFCTPQSPAQEGGDTKATDTVCVKHVVFVDTLKVSPATSSDP